MNTASLILSIISLGIDIYGIINDHIKSKLDSLLNKAIKIAKREAKIDSQHLLGKPIDEKEINKVLLDLVIRKAKNENIDIPNWLGNDFYKFYDSLMQNVDFLNFLHQELENYQHLLQDEKLDEAKKILVEIHNQIELLLHQNKKLDCIDETTKEIKEHVEKSKLPNWLVPYEIELSTNSKTAFLQDAHENLIRENKIYRKKETIETITNWLESICFCLIIAPEGRGKTFLSRIIAFDYHENSTIIYFVDCRNESKSFFNDMKSLLFDWNKDKDKKYLLVLENVHACSNPELLKQTIENQTINQEEISTNIKFLLNARPTIVDYDCFTNWRETINLHPNENDVQEIVNLYQVVTNREPFESEEKMMAFIETISPNDDDSNGANLRLLGIYLRTWQNNVKIQYVSDVTEEDIFNDFIETYKLNDSPDRDTVLLYISSLFQFDVPIHPKAIKQFLRNEGINNGLIENLVKEGLLVKSHNLYYLPHSVEAYFLFKAICYKQKVNYIDETEGFVKFFIYDFILKQTNTKDFEGDFILLVSGLMARKEEFRDIIMELTEWNKAKEIIMKINSGFIIQMLHTENGHSIDSLRNILDSNIDTLRPYILELSPSLLTRLCSGLENHLKYKPEEIYSNIFNNPADLRNYLAHWSAIYNVTGLRHFFFTTKSRRIIKAKHALVCEEFHNSNKQKRNNEQSYDFVFIKEKDQKNLISNASFLKYDEYNKTEFQHFISKLSTEGFYINELNWRQLNLFLRKMGDCIDEAHIKSFQQVANTLVEMIIDKDNVFFEKPNAFEKISSAHLSHFLFNLSRVDDNLYNVIILNDKIIETVKQKLDKLETITIDEIIDYLYLFSYFYSQPWCEARMNNFIDKANEEQQSRTKEWHDKIMAKLYNNEEQIEKDSLLAYIHNKPFIQQQNN